MNVRKSLVTAAAGVVMALGGGQALAQAVDCSTIGTVGAWARAGSCNQGDKIWTYTSSNLDATVQILFSSADPLEHTMQIVGFDNGPLAGAWNIKYDITVVNPALFYISDMFAGADNPVATSLLTKQAVGDPGGTFNLLVVNGAEGPASEKHGLHAASLTVDESFSVGALGILLSVSNTYLEKERLLPTPGSLALLAMGLGALGLSRRNRKLG